MPLIPYADTDVLPEDARQAFDNLPRKLNIFRMWANAQTCFRPGLSFGGAILSKQMLGADLREMIVLANRVRFSRSRSASRTASTRSPNTARRKTRCRSTTSRTSCSCGSTS